MRQYRVGILRVLTTDDQQVFRYHENYLGALFPQFRLSTRAIPDQPQGIHDDASLALAIPKIVELGVEWAPALDGLMVNCAGDPGVGILQDKLSIPVVGGGLPAALLARLYPGKIGILGLEDTPREHYTETIGGRLAGYRKPEGVVTANDLRTGDGRRATLEAAERLVEAGASTIVFACTGFVMGGAKEVLSPLPVRVVDCAQMMGVAMLAECMNRYEL